MAYQVIARKWRPQKFSEVVGQEHIVKTLKNEITLNRTAHAYLFVGPRGIGKTTIARIFAKALNCRDQKNGEPCGKCPSCISITDGSSLDVIEIDGASNNSVDNVRTLRDEVHYTPVGGKYKIYIIDEVHMLSPGAWNALLKTVEEPPSHVKFFFATTEAHRVLGTIVSRCQRFDLQRIPMKLIALNLREIADSEKIRIEDGAIAAIARAADGGMRDGQSLLDQTISFFSGLDSQISEKDVLEIFGLASVADMEKLVEAILQNDPGAVISGIHALASTGRNLERLFEDILSFIRGVEICTIVNDPEKIIEESDENIILFKRMAKNCELRKIQLLLETLSQSSRGLHDALNKQVFLETLILKAMRIAHSAKIEDLIRRIQEIRDSEGLDSLKKNCIDYELTPPAQEVKISRQSFNPTEKIVVQPVKEQAEDTEPQPKPAPAPHPQTTKHAYTPEQLWHELIDHMDKLDKPLLKAYMQEGKPLEVSREKLIVLYDKDFEFLHVKKLNEEIKILDHCLNSITGNRNLKIEFKIEKGVSAPVGPKDSASDVKEIRNRIDKNSFVKNVLDVFEGKILEVRG